MAKAKRYDHPYVNGQLVHDTHFNETFVFHDVKDGFRAHYHPDKLRPATPDEAAAYERKVANQPLVNQPQP